MLIWDGDSVCVQDKSWRGSAGMEESKEQLQTELD